MVALDEITNFSDKKTWDLICRGDTKGVFQLESALGRNWARKVKPRNEYQLSDLIAIIRPGCISGDTKILIKTYKRKNVKRTQADRVQISMRDLYENWKSKQNIKTIISYNENNDTMINNEITNIVYTGVKPVYKINLKRFINRKNDYTWNDLKCTEDHKLLTSDGWKELKDLKLGDRIAIVKRYGGRTRKKLQKGERYFRQICFESYRYHCTHCDWDLGSLDVNHLEGNRKTNNEPNNLSFMCPNHHRLYSENKITKEDVINNREKYKLPEKKSIVWSEYMGKEYCGETDVYDISMNAPYHNFIAGNTVVHNCLDTIIDGKSMTQHYVDRKNGKDEVSYIHPSLEPILNQTYGILIYQEQAIRIAMDIAGFTPERGDALRKAMGKKDAALMNKVEGEFITGCISHGIVDEEMARQIFGLIKASARYSFNASHSLCYAFNSFRSAYCKAHDPLKFYKVYLNHAHNKPDKQQEIRELISDAKNIDIYVYPPRLDHFYKTFEMNRDLGVIYFGYSNVKNVGEGEQYKIQDSIYSAELELNKKIDTFSWYDILYNLGGKIKKTAFISLISVGAFNGKSNDKTRNSMLFEYKTWFDMTKTEREKLHSNRYSNFFGTKSTNYDSLEDGIKYCINHDNTIKERNLKTFISMLSTLRNPPHSLNDTIEWMADVEYRLMGCSLSCSKTDAFTSNDVTCTCRDIISRILRPGYAAVMVKLNRVNEHIIKNGERAGEVMAFLTGEDFTGECSSFVIFPTDYAKFKGLLFMGNTVVLTGQIKEKDSSLSFIVNGVKQV